MRAVAVMILICAIFTLSVSASEAEALINDGLAEAAGGVASASDSSAAEGLVSDNIEDTGASLLEFLTPKEVIEQLSDILLGALPDAVSMLCAVSGLVMISAVCSAVCGAMGDGGISSGFSFLSSAAVIAAIFGTLSGQLARVTDFFDDLCALMESMIPITGAVWAMGGNVTSAGTGTVTLYAMLATTQQLCARTVLPVCCIMGAAAICSGLSDGGMLDGFAGGVKRVYSFLLGLLMTVFVFVLGAQTAVAGAADTAAARGAKLLSSTVIPGVGGAVGDTLRTVAGSVGYIKSVVGVGGIVLVLLLTLPTLISLLLSRLVFLLCSTLAQMLGCKRESKLLSELGGIYGFLVGAVAVCSVAFVIALGLFVRCTVALE